MVTPSCVKLHLQGIKKLQAKAHQTLKRRRSCHTCFGASDLLGFARNVFLYCHALQCWAQENDVEHVGAPVDRTQQPHHCRQNKQHERKKWNDCVDSNKRLSKHGNKRMFFELESKQSSSSKPHQIHTLLFGGFSTCLLVRIPGLFCVRGTLKIFFG